MTDRAETPVSSQEPEGHFKPIGTIFILGLFMLALILLWASVYVILLSRGTTS